MRKLLDNIVYRSVNSKTNIRDLAGFFAFLPGRVSRACFGEIILCIRQPLLSTVSSPTNTVAKSKSMQSMPYSH
jgi:hypothetical protein